MAFFCAPQCIKEVDSRTISNDTWNFPGGSTSHNGHFPLFDYSPPFSLKWEKKLNITTVPLNLAINSEFVLLANGNKSVQVIDKNNGNKVREIDSGATFTKNYVSMSNDTLFLGTKNGISGYSISSGEKKWQTAKVFSDKIADFTPYVITYNDYLIANYGSSIAIFPTYVRKGAEVVVTPFEISSDNIIDMLSKGSIFAYITENKIIFSKSSFSDKRFEYYTYYGIEKHSSGPIALINDYVIHASNKTLSNFPIESVTGSGKIVVISMNSEESSYELVFENSAVMSTPSSDGDQLIASFSDGNVRSYDLKSGAFNWSFKTNGTVYCQPIITSKFVFFASSDSCVYAVDKISGNMVWKYKLSSPVVSSSMAIDEENLYVLSKDGVLSRFEISKENKPCNIVITIDENNIRLDKTCNIKVSVFNESNYQINNNVNLTVFPPENGKIANNVFIPKKPGECKIIAKIGAIISEKIINVYNKPPTFNVNYNLGEIHENESRKELISFTNNTEFPVSIELKNSKNFCYLPEQFILINSNETRDVELVLNGSLINYSGENTFYIDVVTENIESKSIKLVIKKNEVIKPSFIPITIEDIDPNGNIKKIQYTIKNNNLFLPFSFVLSCKEDWISIKDNIFIIDPGKDYSFEIEINQTKFIYLEEKIGEIIIEWNKNVERLKIKAKSIADIIPPEITIDPIQTYKNAKFCNITGTIEKECTLDLQVENGFARVPVVAGKFNLTVNLLPGPSLNKYTLLAKDAVGNETTKIVEIINTGIIIIKLQIGNPIMTVGDKSVAISPAPMVFKGATIIPLRALGEAFGAMVNFQNGEITVTLREKIIKLRINSNEAVVNGVKTQVNPPPVIIQGKTMVPFRFIAEALGAQVFWDQSTKQISIHAEVWPTI